MRMIVTKILAAMALVHSGAPAFAQEDAGATAATAKMFEDAAKTFDWSDRQDFEDALRGRIATYPKPAVVTETGHVVWEFRDDEGMRDAPPPSTVHPLLWRQQQLNAIHGLFKVTDGIYQLRGFDLANMTVIEGETGIIIVDPLTSVEISKAALDLYYLHRPKRPVVAVLYTHSHLDHFGGVRGVVSAEDVDSGKVQIIAPGGFLKQAVSENVSAGTAMLRRTIFYSGIMIPEGPTGSVGAGLGAGVANGKTSFLAPTEEIEEHLATRTIDGIEFVFLSANGTEAPSEFVFYLPQFKVLDVAEVATKTVHNVLTPRGAQARDAGLWWHTIDEMIERFGGQTDILIGQHHWPSWGQEAAIEHLENQRDFYKAVYDRSLHMANKGATIHEIGEQLTLPPGLENVWSTQDYYGTLGSAGQATYQFNLGWYDGNPANLHALPDVDSAARYVDYMGGSEAILERAEADFNKGEYRWVAEVLNRLLFAQPDNPAARALQARTFRQLGYQQSSSTWRSLYLTAARELEGDVLKIPAGARSSDFLSNMTAEMLLDYAGIALSPERSADRSISLALEFRDLGKSFGVAVDRGLLHYSQSLPTDAQATISLERSGFDALLTGRKTLAELLDDGTATLTGDREAAGEFFGLFDRFTPDFNLVTP